MAPSLLPCKCSEAVPKEVKTSFYRVRASIEGCQKKNYCRLLHLQLGIDLEDQFYWNSCQCNEFDGLMRRHFIGNVAGYVPGNPAFKMLEKELHSLRSTVPCFSRVDHKTLIENTRSSIKNRYRRAYANLILRVVNVSELQSRIKAFVKYEKIPVGKFEAGKPPRIIQFRDFTYLYCLKRELLPFSMSVKAGQCGDWNHQDPRSVLTKTQDNYGTAAVLRESWDMFVDPVAICLDHSKFDGHYCSELLELETKFWQGLNPSRMLQYLLSQQFVNRGATPHRLKYKVKGGRMSGEYTTSDGNSIMNYCMIVTWLKHHKVDMFRVHVNGDDSVIVVDRQYSWLSEDLDFFRNFNMETECGAVVDDFRLISYCQAQPIRVLKGQDLVWYMVKEPRRTIARLQYCDQKFFIPWKRFARGVGLCELAVNSGVPITQSLALWMISEGDKPLGCVDKRPALISGNDVSMKAIPPETRVDYEIAFDIPVQLQLDVESYLAGLLRSPTDLDKILRRYQHFHKH